MKKRENIRKIDDFDGVFLSALIVSLLIILKGLSMSFSLNFCPRQRSSSTSSLPTIPGGQSSSSSRKSRATGDVVKPESPTMKQDQRSKIKKILQTLATSATSTSSRREDYKYTRLNSSKELPVKDNSVAHMPPEISYGAMPYFDGNACITGFQLCASRSVRHIKE